MDKIEKNLIEGKNGKTYILANKVLEFTVEDYHESRKTGGLEVEKSLNDNIQSAPEHEEININSYKNIVFNYIREKELET